MGTRSTCNTQKSRNQTHSRLTSRQPDITELEQKQTANFRNALDADFADALFATVLERCHRQLTEVEAKRVEEVGGGRAQRACVSVLGLQGNADSVTCRTK